MPAGQKRTKRKRERHAFGLTVFDTGHPEVRRLQQGAAQPSLHGQKVWRSSFLLMDYLEQHGLTMRARVLELGCGWGLVGIYCPSCQSKAAAVFPVHVHWLVPLSCSVLVLFETDLLVGVDAFSILLSCIRR